MIFAALLVAPAATAKENPTPKLPVVLVHGFGGFAWYPFVGRYFAVAEQVAVASSVQTFTPALTPFASIAERAEELAAVVDRVRAETGAKQVHLVGHSQGGVDAWWFAATDRHARVASVTTLAAPHEGSAVAGLLSERVPDVVLDVVGAILILGFPSSPDRTGTPSLAAALRSLSPAQMKETHSSLSDAAAVPLFAWLTVAGGPCPDLPRGQRAGAPQVWLWPTWTLGRLFGEENDGLVGVASAARGQVEGCLLGDHVEVLGLGGASLRSDGAPNVDTKRLYRRIFARLAWVEANARPQAGAR